jgi:hypothetical protein
MAGTVAARVGVGLAGGKVGGATLQALRSKKKRVKRRSLFIYKGYFE